VKKIAALILTFLLIGPLYSQDEPEIQQDISLSLVCMEFDGSHSQIPEKVSLIFEEIQKQELQSKIQGDLFGVFFDSPLLEGSGRPVYALGFEIEPDAPVKAPLQKCVYAYEQVATIIHCGHFETVANSVNILLPFIEENDMEIAGPPAEIWRGDPYRDKPEDLKTTILIPVRDKSI
jgi:effector-binding domain-containing protein